MTAGNNGASTPEDDDPFGYLYADGQRAGASSPRQGGYGYPGPAPQPGVPRTSYNQVRTVGQRQYGQQQTGQQYGQVPHQQQYGQQPGPQYAAPETYPGGAPTRQAPAPSGGGGGRGRGPNTRGLLIGAVAVVAVVVVGITAALMTGGDDKAENPQADGSSTAPAEEVRPSEEPSEDDEEKPAGLPKQDAATLRLGAPAALAKDVKGAKGADGAYVVFNGAGGSASWTVDIPADGAYTLFITYSVPGKDAKTSLTINDTQPRSVNMSNFARAKDGDWEKGWTRTYAYVNLEEGSNTLKISCEQGDQCDALLDQVWLEAGQSKG
ncbi:carbohydrate-binding protein [Streptomyces spongiicola]|uniref:Carbohydrate-binding protein n=1 Tax=Streptomyces spongiicola TaxID=1690221 RepID=A0A2S1Z0F8_9ACTN|nr:carbohydrate-binding protein [Streptomyces spongiicola]AWK09825.1 carbohydrate-binding protein [Streptomyces spongiicola]GBQ04074.1 carbohydrate-binding protein [Streptomyces spongiicola]